jgi:hypothetical protein
MSSINIDSSNLPYGSYTLSIYAIDKVGNIIPPINRRLSTGFFGINHNNRILSIRKYPHNYPSSQPPSVPFPNQSTVSTILQDIKSMGLNAVRINMYWEAYRWYKSQRQASTFINRLREIASTADSLGLGILYNVMHQWKVSSVLYSSSSSTSRGVGFPEECFIPLNLIPSGFHTTGNSYIYDKAIDGSSDINKIPKNIFWKAFATNYNVTIDGVTKGIWEHIWDDYFRDVVLATKDYNSTIGYELINEPMEAVDSITTDEYQGLGNYYSFIAQNIRQLTADKMIFFSELISWRHNDAQINSVYPDLAGKTAQYKKAELTVRLMLPRDKNGQIINGIAFSNTEYGKNGTFSASQINQYNEYDRVFNNLKQSGIVTNLQTVFTEMNEQDPAQGGTEPTTNTFINYLTILKERRYGWFYFNYDPNYPWSIKDSAYNDRKNSQSITYKKMLIDAMQTVYRI